MNVTCTIEPENNRVHVWRNGYLVAGMHEQNLEGTPQVTFISDNGGTLTLNLDDLDIMTDNWNQLQELRKTQDKG